MAAHKFHFLLDVMNDVTLWCTSLGQAFMDGYTLTPNPMDSFNVSLERLKQGLPTKPFTICFETDDEEMAIMFKLRFADWIVDESQI
jgi:hypothetical protein